MAQQKDYWSQFEPAAQDNYWSKFEPAESQLQEPEEKSLHEKWNELWINKPLLEAPSRWGHQFSEWISHPTLADVEAQEKAKISGDIGVGGILGPYAKGLLGGTAEGIGDVISSFSTPLNLATLGAFKGAGALAGRAGEAIPAAAKALNWAGRGLSVPVAGSGLAKIAAAESPTDIGFGVAELAGGLAGAGEGFSPKPRVSEITPPEALSPLHQPPPPGTPPMPHIATEAVRPTPPSPIPEFTTTAPPAPVTPPPSGNQTTIHMKSPDPATIAMLEGQGFMKTTNPDGSISMVKGAAPSAPAPAAPTVDPNVTEVPYTPETLGAVTQDMRSKGWKLENVTAEGKAIFRRFVDETKGEFDWEELKAGLRRLLGREPTEAEVTQEAFKAPREGPQPGETTGRVAPFEPGPLKIPSSWDAAVNQTMMEGPRLDDQFGPRPEVPPQDIWDEPGTTSRFAEPPYGQRVAPGFPDEVIPNIDQPVPLTMGQQELPMLRGLNRPEPAQVEPVDLGPTPTMQDFAPPTQYSLPFGKRPGETRRQFSGTPEPPATADAWHDLSPGGMVRRAAELIAKGDNLTNAEIQELAEISKVIREHPEIKDAAAREIIAANKPAWRWDEGDPIPEYGSPQWDHFIEQNPGHTTDYILPNGKTVKIHTEIARGAEVMDFQTAEGMKKVIRADLMPENLKTEEVFDQYRAIAGEPSAAPPPSPIGPTEIGPEGLPPASPGKRWNWSEELKRFIEEDEGSIAIPSRQQIQEAAKKVKGFTGWGQGASRKTKPKGPDEYNVLKEALMFPSAATTTGDLSPLGRQGLTLINTRQFWEAIPKAAQSLHYDTWKRLDNLIRTKPNWQRHVDPRTGKVTESLAERAGMKLFSPASEPGPRAEAVASRWLENIPILGLPIRATNRFYISFLNHLQANRFDYLMNRAKDISLQALNDPQGRAPMQGILGEFGIKRKYSPQESIEVNPYLNGERAKEIADFVRTAVGQAPLKTHVLPFKQAELSLESVSGKAASVLFSPGMLASRIRMLNPNTYIMASPFVRKQYLKAAIGAGLGYAAFMTMAKYAAEAQGIEHEINTDITNSDFGKFRIGNTRLDPGAGFLQFMVLLGRMYKGGWTSSSNPEEGIHPFGADYQAETQLSNMIRFGSNKLNPVWKFAWDIFDASENKLVAMGDRTAQMFVPLFVQDVLELAKQNPELLPWIAPVAFGVGTQTYGKYGENPLEQDTGRIIPSEYDWQLGGWGLNDMMPWNPQEDDGQQPY